MIANKILLQRKYARIVKLFAENNHISYEEALNLFYNSKTFELISNGIADMHCLSDEYLADVGFDEMIQDLYYSYRITNPYLEEK